jgi:glycosyltransferase involved in cell wall biosynthesis
MLEAMALGKAVISSDCKTGPRELTSSGKYGVLVPVADDTALANAIKDLMSNPDKRHNLARNAAFHICNAYSEDKVFGHLIKTIEETAS